MSRDALKENIVKVVLVKKDASKRDTLEQNAKNVKIALCVGHFYDAPFDDTIKNKIYVSLPSRFLNFKEQVKETVAVIEKLKLKYNLIIVITNSLVVCNTLMEIYPNNLEYYLDGKKVSSDDFAKAIDEAYSLIKELASDIKG